MQFPKKKWSEPELNPKGKAEIAEEHLQKFADDFIETYKMKHFRITDSMWSGLRLALGGKWNWLLIQIRKTFGGKMPDCLLYESISKRYWLAFPLELKTQDANKKAVGTTRGRQKTFSKNDRWTFARSPEDIAEELSQWEIDCNRMTWIFSKFETVKDLCDFLHCHL